MDDGLALTMRDSISRRALGYVSHASLVAVVVGVPYAVGSLLSFSWFNAGGMGATFFPAAGVTLAALLLLERRWWPAAVAGAATAEVFLDRVHDLSWQASAGYALANSVEPLVGASAIVLLVGRPVLTRPRDLFGFGIGGVVLGPACGAAIGATTFVSTEGSEWLRFAGEWWLGDGLGVLVIGTATYTLFISWPDARRPTQLLATGVMLSASVTATALVFWREELVLAFVPIALLLVIAFRLGTCAVSLVGASVAILAAQATASGHVFWDALGVTPDQGLTYLQLTLGFVIATPLLLSAALHSRDAAVTELAVAAKRAALFDATTALSRTTTLHQTLEALLRHGPGPFAADGASVAIADGDKVVVHSSPGVVRPGDELEAHRSAIDRRMRTTRIFGNQTLAVAPFPRLSAGPDGAIGLMFTGQRRLAGTEWQRLEALAELAANAIGRSHLVELESRARRSAEILESSAERLAASLTVAEVARTTVTDVLAAGASGAVFYRVSGNAAAEVVHAAGIPAAVLDELATTPLSRSTLVAATITSGRPEFVSSAEEYNARFPMNMGLSAAAGAETLAGVPVRSSEGPVIGAIVLTSVELAWLTPERLALLTGLATQAGVALERATLFEVEREERARAARAEARLRRLHRFIEAITAETDPATLPRRIVEQLQLACDAPWVALLDLEHETPPMSESVGVRPPGLGRGLKRSELEQLRAADSSGQTLVNELAGFTVVSIPLRGQSVRFGAAHLVVPPSEVVQETSERIEFFESLGRQTGLAFERDKLMRDEARARGRAELMTTILSELEGISGFERRARRLVELLVPRVGDFASVEQPTSDERPVLAAAHVDPVRGEVLERLRLNHRLPDDHSSSVSRALSGEARLLPSIGPEVVRQHVEDGETRRLLEQLGPRSIVVAPLATGDDVIGALMVGLTDPDRRPYDEGDFGFIKELATRVATVLENARLEEEDNRTALRLQQALLPGMLPEIPGLSSAGLYEAAQERLEIGGDWFDLIEVGPGRTAIVVGDVVGHGLESAVTMGQLRTAVAAFAMSECEPDAVLDRLEQFAEPSVGAHYSTVAYALLDSRSGRIRYSLAGHPPPLVIAPDGTTTLLEGGRSTPLCALGPRPRPLAEATLEVGSMIILYTDGLVERRGTSLGARLEQLQRVAGAASHLAPDQVCDKLLLAMTEGRPTDDVAILAVRLNVVESPTLTHRFPAEPPALASAREALRRWLTEVGLDEGAKREIVLGVGEALGNAVEHAYSDQCTGEVELSATVRDCDEIEIAVRDWGGWRTRTRPADERGRGLPIMRALFDSLDVDRQVGGTTVTLTRATRSRSLE